MYRKQLGRRNLTDEQKTYMIGKMYEARKKSVGQHEGNQYTKMENGQNVQIPNRREIKDGTSGEIGKEFGIDGKTVRRNLTNYDRARLALRLKPILQEEAKKRMLSGKSDPVLNSAQGGKGAVRDELAKIAGVGHDKPFLFFAAIFGGNRDSLIIPHIPTGGIAANSNFD